MFRFCLFAALIGTHAALVVAEDKPTPEEANRIKRAEAAAIADPNNEEKREELRSALFWHLSRSEEPDDVETVIAVHQAMIDSFSKLKPTDAQAIESVNHTIDYCRTFISNYRAPLSDLEKLLDANPDDFGAMGAFSWRSRNLVEKLGQTDSAKATAIMNSLKARIAKTTESCKTDSMRTYMEAHATFMPVIERQFNASRRHGLLIGNDAPALEVETWVNSKPKKLEDLKGKVVLVDFWAVWCGPCIESFPKLRDWQKRFSDKGLVIIGISRSCNFAFDEITGRATWRKGEEAPPDEPELLRKFADFHQLIYPLGTEKQGSKQNEAYACAAIPQIVLIGKDGKIKMIRTGGSSKTAKEIEVALERLLRE